MNTDKLRKYIFFGALTIFILLSAHYFISPNRWQTKGLLKQQGSQTGHDYMLSSLNVTTISQDHHKQIWIGTSAGINVFNGHDYTQYFHDPGDTTALPDDYINAIIRDSKGRMWIGTQNGLARHDGAGQFHRIKLPSQNNNITSLTEETATGNIIVGNGREWFRVNNDSVTKTQSPTHELKTTPIDELKTWAADYPEAEAALAKPKELISCTYKDAGGNLWIGYRNAGYQVLSENIIAFKTANDNPLALTTQGKDITCMNSTGHYILAGTTLRLYVYDTKTHAVTYQYYDCLFNSKDILTGIVTLDDTHVCLIGQHHVLLCALDNDGVSIQQNISSDALLGSATLIDNDVYISCQTPYIKRHRKGSGNIDSIAVNHLQYDEETQVTTLHDGRLLLFMKDMHVAVYNPKEQTLKEITTTGVRQPGSIDPAFVREDSRGNIWLGTKRSGLYRLDMKQRKMERMNFVGDVHIQALIEDSQQQIWITTLKDAICYQPTTGAVLMNSLVSSSQNSWTRQYFDNSLTIAPNSDIVLGSSDGCIFLPHKAGNKMNIANKSNNKTYDQSRALENGLCIYTMGVQTEDGKKFTADIPVNDSPHFTLSHDERNLDFSFFYPNYSRRSSLMYQCKLEGYDKDWSKTTYDNTAHYANLAPGKYTFRLRLMSSPYLQPLNEKVIHITIMPAPWSSPAAWWLYICLAALAVYYINSLYLRIRTNRMLLQQEKHEREREKFTNEMNMNFFANISHEFRNPITLIAGPLLSLKSDSSLPSHTTHTLDRVCMSVNRMLRLIDQMLDFNQLETDALRLKVTHTNAEKEISEMITTFEESANVRGIKLETDIAPCDYDSWIDIDKLEKILSNLFTNALKHTPSKGVIRITVQRINDKLNVKVYNSGSHIDDDKLQYVFLRYYQLPDTQGIQQYGWGTGIGLYYVKRLVGLHHGEIRVSNESDGVAFTFWLPMDKSSYTDEECSSQRSRVMQIPLSNDSETVSTDANESQLDGNTHKAKILVVDDDIDVAQYIRSLFSTDYIVENRYSAEEALADLETTQPDIILSDIVMGGMSGYEFCHKLKSDLMFCHIPVILITAKSNVEEQVEGLKQGALAYITKPFDPTYLKAMVETQLASMNRLRQRLGESTETKELSESVADTLSEQDRKFMDELYSLMEKRAAEMELNVATVSRDLLISQSKFNYKLKELTGETPGSFFRKYKLNKAAQWLKEGKYNVSEVAIKTGFSTAAHFSVAFKKQFGVSPSDYR